MSEVEGTPDAVDRFFKQAIGTAQPEFPKGKLNPDDEGALAFAIAVDTTKKLMIVNFNKPVTWLGLYLPDAKKLHEAMGKKIKELEELHVSEFPGFPEPIKQQTEPPSPSK
jgi:hypothetical protein